VHEVSIARLYALRATYLLIAVGLGFTIWPGVLNPPANLEHYRGVVRSVLAAVSLLAVLGLRYPLTMLPLLLFELVWKTIWVVAIGLPLWRGDQFDPATLETWNACLMGLVLFPLVIPWRYVVETYVRAPSDRWRSARRWARGARSVQGGASRRQLVHIGSLAVLLGRPGRSGRRRAFAASLPPRIPHAPLRHPAPRRAAAAPRPVGVAHVSPRQGHHRH
jgi:hypothetical protein